MKTIALTGIYGKGKYALIDDEDFIKVSKYKWFLSSPKNHTNQYIRTRIGKNSDIRLHRFIMSFPIGYQIDHINGDTLDNRKNNLRLCNNRTNQQNSKCHKDKMKINGIIPPKGVMYDKTRPLHPWVATIFFNKKQIHSKGYKTVKEAKNEYNKMASKYFGEFARFS